jgi:methylglyoxal synthase
VRQASSGRVDGLMAIVRIAEVSSVTAHPAHLPGACLGFSLIATRHTARLLRDKVGLDVEELLSGPEGGDAQIAARVAIQSVDAVFFFVDPLSAQPHDPDIRALLRVCNVHNVPLATNVATADLIIAAFDLSCGTSGQVPARS